MPMKPMPTMPMRINHGHKESPRLAKMFGPPGYEVNLLYVAGLLALILGGAGAFSIDRLLGRRKREPAASPS